jgi:hypothetical protein
MCPVFQSWVAMRFRVLPLRRKGRKLAWRDVQNGPSYCGDLITHIREVKGEFVVVATLTNPLAPVTAQLLPELHQPVLVWVSPLALRLRGFERCDDSEGAYGVVQEWHCELA